MTKAEAKKILLNTAWLGTDKDRDKTIEAVELLTDTCKYKDRPCVDLLKLREYFDNLMVKDSPYDVVAYHPERLRMDQILDIIDRFIKEQDG